MSSLQSPSPSPASLSLSSSSTYPRADNASGFALAGSHVRWFDKRSARATISVDGQWRRNTGRRRGSKIPAIVVAVAAVDQSSLSQSIRLVRGRPCDAPGDARDSALTHPTLQLKFDPKLRGPVLDQSTLQRGINPDPPKYCKAKQVDTVDQGDTFDPLSCAEHGLANLDPRGSQRPLTKHTR